MIKKSMRWFNTRIGYGASIDGQVLSCMTSNAEAPGQTQNAEAPGGRDQRVKLPVYKNLLEINTGFDQVIRGLGALRKHGAFLEQREE